ncbi:MAG: divalent-cation tolerance protein CutA [Deltaproteobacteria bacterium]|nr:divalent-cation tolerance protein CutA [Deltaproteobacteria bacterium]
MRLVLVTCAPHDAEPLLRRLLEERLVACGNILPGVRSLYWWKGAIQDDPEEVLLMETSTDRVSAVVARARALHSYETPKIVTFEVRESDPDYAAWLAGVVR